MQIESGLACSIAVNPYKRSGEVSGIPFVASIYDLKPKFQALLRPMASDLVAVGVTANQITIAALLLSVLMGVLIGITGGARWALLLLPLVLFIRMAMNALDGMLAREFGQRSNLGAILNELGDVAADAALYLPFVYVAGLDPRLIIAVVVLSLIVEMAGVLGLQVGASRRYDGPFGKSDRAFFFGAMAIILALNLAPISWMNPFLWAAVILSGLTIFNRARGALKEAANGFG